MPWASGVRTSPSVPRLDAVRESLNKLRKL